MELDFEYKPDSIEQAQLAQTMATPGFQVVVKLMKSVADGFTIRLLNTPHEKTEQVISNHNMAQMAAQFFTSFANQLNEESMEYINALRPSDKPIDTTEGILDIGELSINTEMLDTEDVWPDIDGF